ncbi:MAG: FKBP-type peptidyl-prolyl cis-trans isomerase [Planctomycetes bacterium]|nr:FKBP-type peptidyl-prolyl cis-trans isomerase [Planctomycetota bacterium]
MTRFTAGRVAVLAASALLAGAGCESKTEPAKPATTAPKVEAPKIDAAKPAAPKTEAPKTDAPKAAETPSAPAADKKAESPNVQKLPNGLQIEDLKVGEGDPCPADATVTIHYRGTLLNGKEFDSSYNTGQPATFPLKRLIQGWQEGIPGMKKGGKRKLTIPYAMAYGAAGSPPDIPPKSDLIFEIELFDFKK